MPSTNQEVDVKKSGMLRSGSRCERKRKSKNQRYYREDL